MNSSGMQLELWLGRLLAAPAPAYVMRQLVGVEVSRRADGVNSFRLDFRVDRESGDGGDFDLLSGGLVDPWSRVVVMARLAGRNEVLMDGFITAQTLDYDRSMGAARLVASGEDVSIAMDRLQYSMEYPQMGDAAIAEIVLAKYLTLGIEPEVTPTALDLVPIEIERTPQQNATDRSFLTELAVRNGYRFTIVPGPIPLTNRAVWGPPFNFGLPQKPLSVDLGASTNVEKISFALDAKAPVQVLGMVQDNVTEEDMPLATVFSSRMPPLATHPALDAVGPMQAREMFTDPRLGYVQAMNAAQVRTDMTSQGALVVSGELDTLRYGAVLDTPGVVDLRGAGRLYNGRYRVEEVSHTLSLGAYRQSFKLSREGVGSTIALVSP